MTAKVEDFTTLIPKRNVQILFWFFCFLLREEIFSQGWLLCRTPVIFLHLYRTKCPLLLYVVWHLYNHYFNSRNVIKHSSLSLEIQPVRELCQQADVFFWRVTLTTNDRSIVDPLLWLELFMNLKMCPWIRRPICLGSKWKHFANRPQEVNQTKSGGICTWGHNNLSPENVVTRGFPCYLI